MVQFYVPPSQPVQQPVQFVPVPVPVATVPAQATTSYLGNNVTGPETYAPVSYYQQANPSNLAFSSPYSVASAYGGTPSYEENNYPASVVSAVAQNTEQSSEETMPESEET